MGLLRALTALHLGYCREVTEVGVRAASSRALTAIGLRCCHKVTAALYREAQKKVH